MTINVILLILFVLTALWAVMSVSLLRAAIALAFVSIALTALMFRLASPLAAVFELSVCAGLITVIFMSAISLTKPLSKPELVEAAKARFKRIWYLPVITVILGIFLAFVTIPVNFNPAASQADGGVRNVLWNFRQVDLLGQIIALLVGAFAIAVLFKSKSKVNK